MPLVQNIQKDLWRGFLSLGDSYLWKILLCVFLMKVLEGSRWERWVFCPFFPSSVWSVYFWWSLSGSRWVFISSIFSNYESHFSSSFSHSWTDLHPHCRQGRQWLSTAASTPCDTINPIWAVLTECVTHCHSATHSLNRAWQHCLWDWGRIRGRFTLQSAPRQSTNFILVIYCILVIVWSSPCTYKYISTMYNKVASK